MQKNIIVYDIGAANFVPKHFPLDNRFEYVHIEPDNRGLKKLKTWLKSKKSKAQHLFFQKAIGAKLQKAVLGLAEKNTSSKILETAIGGSQIEVEMETLPYLIEHNNLKAPNIIKIDVEGFELKVLNGIDLNDDRLKVIEIEVTLNSDTLSGVITLLTSNKFQLVKVRTHGDQDHNPRNWLRGKIHGLTRKLNLANYAVVKSEDSWSKPSTPLTQIEFVFIRNIDLLSNDPVQKIICDIFGLAHRKGRSGRLKCGDRSVGIIKDLTLIR